MRSGHLVGTAAAFGIAAAASRAEACGGCFHEPPVNVQSTAADTVVTGHRMVFAVSPNRTVLWDQIKFSGSPNEFGWVLPVSPGATIEESNDAWFEALEAFTATQVESPNVTCTYPNSGSFGFGSGSGRGCGCGASEDSAASALAAGDAGSSTIAQQPPPVTVVHEGTVGPYETVTLSSKDGSALRNWLAQHGYVVPPEIDPVIDSYVAEGADFIALRLIPGKGINQMKPVRVVTPSGSPILPLRMVAAGTGDFVDIVLYIVGEGRYGLDDLKEAFVDWQSLTFDFTTNDSNYSKIRQQALDANNGFSYVTTFSEPHPFDSKFEDSSGIFSVNVAGSSYSELASIYFAEAAANDGKIAPDCALDALGSGDLVIPGGPPRAHADAGAPPQKRDAGSARPEGGVPSPRDGGARIADGGSRPSAEGGAAADGGPRTRTADAGAPSAKADAGAPSVEPPPGTLFASSLSCNGYSDVAAALVGMHPNQVWMSRLEMNLPHEALSMDCHVGLDSRKSVVSNRPAATKFTGDPCPPGAVAAGMAGPPASSAAFFRWAVGSFAALGLARRKRRRG